MDRRMIRLDSGTACDHVTGSCHISITTDIPTTWLLMHRVKGCLVFQGQIDNAFYEVTNTLEIHKEEVALLIAFGINYHSGLVPGLWAAFGDLLCPYCGHAHWDWGCRSREELS